MTAAELQPWARRPFLCIDAETTGTDPLEDRIVELAVVEVDRHGDADEAWSTIVDPGLEVEIPDEAAAIHGITTERARDEGIDLEAALEYVAERIYRHHETWEGQAAQVMFNARFDLPLLISEAERRLVPFPCFASILDPFLIDRLCDRWRAGKRRLTLVADHYEVELDEADAHGALADATAAGRVMVKLLERYPQVGAHTLAWVWLRQVQGHEQDHDRFVDYLRQTTDPTIEAAPGWPIPARRQRRR